MDFAAPPEITSTLIYTGPGAASLIAAAAAWADVAEQLERFAVEHTAVINSVNAVWLGAADSTMTQCSTAIIAWIRTTAEQATQMSATAAHAAAAFDTVHATITPPTMVFANRLLLAELTATNLLGQNSPAIAACETQYSEMWATNTAAMSTYHATSAQATGPLTTFMNLATSVPGLDSIIAPGSNQSTTGLAGLLNLLSGSTGSALGSFINSNLFANAFVGAVISSGDYAPSNWLGPFTGFMMAQQSEAIVENSKGEPIAVIPRYESPGVRVTLPPPPVSAQIGVGQPVGALTAPPSWTQKAPALGVPARLEPEVNISNAAPLVEASGIPLPLPIPVGGIRGGTPPKTDKPPPEYGQQPTIMPKHPYGG